VRRREDQLAALCAGAQPITSTLELGEVLDQLARATVETMGVQGVSIGLVEASGTRVVLAASHGSQEARIDQGPLVASESPVYREILSGGPPVILRSADELARLHPAGATGVGSILLAPLVGKRGTLGVVRAYSADADAFDDDSARFLAAIAAQGAIAIENAMSYQMLRNLDEEKSKFTRAVTHELRAPVNAAQSLLNLVLGRYAGPLEPRQVEYLWRLHRRLQTLRVLIDDLLYLAAERAGFAVEEARTLPVLDILNDAVAQHEQMAQERRQLLAVEPGPDAAAIAVRATAEGLSRIFTNLVGNAVKYTPERGRVEVSLRRVDHEAEVRVVDTGIGIPADAMGKLFTEFYRAPNAKAFEAGTGLGLVILKELVERFHGKVTVESVEGRGSTFTVTLPLVEA